MSIQEQIDTLWDQIHVLEKKQHEENRVKILPFLQEHATLVWNGSYHLGVEFDSNENENTAIKLLNDVDGAGSYHMGTEISKDITFRYDDGHISVNFLIGGLVSDMGNKILHHIKEYGLKMEFDTSIKAVQLEISKAENKLEKLRQLKQKYLNQSNP